MFISDWPCDFVYLGSLVWLMKSMYDEQARNSYDEVRYSMVSM